MKDQDLSKKLQSLDALEDDFGDQLDLHDFYDSASLSEDEMNAATPLLNSLKIDRTRYGSSSFQASGGEKSIDKVFDFCTDRHVAMAQPLKKSTPIDREDFLREARITALLQHPNIMPIHDIGLNELGIPYFTMDFISGESLEEILHQLSRDNEAYKNKYSLSVLLSLFQKVCDAISYAHSRGILHLDLKPGNINVGSFGEVTVYDWGLAKVLKNERAESEAYPDLDLDAELLNDITLAGVVKGTPGYLAPEQIGNEQEKTIATDNYALGAILYSILTYRAPITASSMEALIKQTKAGEIKDPKILCPEKFIPVSLSSVCLKALSTKPEDRYTSVNKFQEEISKYQHGFATEAQHATLWVNLKLLIKRHQRVFLLLVVFSFILTLFAVFSFIRINQERDQAIAAKIKAEQNFQLYKSENELKQKLDQDLRSVVHQSSLGGDVATAHIMIESLEKAIADQASGVDKEQLMRFKGDLHFSLQEFNQAKKSYEKTNEVLYGIASEFAELKPNDEAILNAAQLGDLIERFTSYQNKYVAYQTFYYHMLRTEESSPRSYTKAVKNLLDLLNNTAHWIYGDLVLQENERGNHLNLSGSPYKTFVLPIATEQPYNVLSCLAPKSIDFSHSAINDLERLIGLELDLVNVKGTSIGHEKVNLMIEVLKLKTLVIDQGQIEESKLKNFQKKIELQFE
jgi:hypothetical protein